MPVSIEGKSLPCRLLVMHRPYHLQAAQLIEYIIGINKNFPDWISIISQDPYTDSAADRKSVAQLRLLLDRGLDRGDVPKPD